MPDFLLQPLPVFVLLALVGVAVHCGRAWWRRRRRGCPHTRYRGAAGVVCIGCHRERRRIADHLRRASGGGVPMP